MQMHTQAADEQIVSAEAGRILGVDRATLIRWVGTGAVTPSAKLPGRTGAYLFRRGDIEALAATKREASA